jgi:hypothetical protein
VPVPQFINYYRCPDDGTQWTMIWSCMCDDRCPTCNHEIVPYRSGNSQSDDLKALVPNLYRGSSHDPAT